MQKNENKASYGGEFQILFHLQPPDILRLRMRT